MNEYYYTSVTKYDDFLSMDYTEFFAFVPELTCDYTFFHVDEPNVIGINERMVND